MRGRARNAVAVATYVVVPVAAILLLHGLGTDATNRVDWADLSSWLTTSSFEGALVAILRSVGLALAYWLATTTTIYLVARSLGWIRIANSIGWLTLPIVRRAADRVLAGSLAITTLAAPGVAWTRALSDTGSPVTAAPIVELPDPYYTTFESVNGDDNTPSTSVDGLQTDPIVDYPEPEIIIFADASLEVIVRPGDNLWDLAARRIQNALGRDVGDFEVAPYWIEVILANQQRIKSGDPDLIHPGEVILLPPVRV